MCQHDGDFLSSTINTPILWFYCQDILITEGFPVLVDICAKLCLLVYGEVCCIEMVRIVLKVKGSKYNKVDQKSAPVRPEIVVPFGSDLQELCLCGVLQLQVDVLVEDLYRNHL
jgi:hypothetical protein